MAARVLVRDPGEGWTMPLDARSSAIALDAPTAGVVREFEALSLSSVRLEGFDAPCMVERLEDVRSTFALVRGDRKHRGRVVWLLFSIVSNERDESPPVESPRPTVSKPDRSPPSTAPVSAPRARADRCPAPALPMCGAARP